MEGEYFIDFTTREDGGLDAVRVRIDLVRIPKSRMNELINIGLADHPLYKELQLFVKSNPR
jgi:hypothetical protein